MGSPMDPPIDDSIILHHMHRPLLPRISPNNNSSSTSTSMHSCSINNITADALAVTAAGKAARPVADAAQRRNTSCKRSSRRTAGAAAGAPAVAAIGTAACAAARQRQPLAQQQMQQQAQRQAH